MKIPYRYPRHGRYADHKKALKRTLAGTGTTIRPRRDRMVDICGGTVPPEDVLALLYLFGIGEIV